MSRSNFISLLAALAFILPVEQISALSVGDKLPDCKIMTSNSAETLNVQTYTGNVLYVDFWASWCPPCAKSFPYMNAMSNQYKDKDLKIIGINLDESPDDAGDFLNKHPANFPVFSDLDTECARAFAVQAMPTTYLVDRKGIIRHIHYGFRSSTADELQQKIDYLLAEN